VESRYVIDAGILALYFAGDQRVKKYFNEIFQGVSEGYLCEVNLAEFYYKTAEKLGIDTADIRYEAIGATLINKYLLKVNLQEKLLK